MAGPIQVASPINAGSAKKQVIELVVERLSENYFALSFRKQKDKLVQPYVAPLFSVYTEDTKQALYDGLCLLGVYNRRDDSQPDGRKLADPRGASGLCYRQFLGRLKEDEGDDEFDLIAGKATVWFNNIASKKYTPNSTTTFKFPATVVFGDNVSAVPVRPVADVLCRDDALEVLKASYGTGNLTLHDFLDYKDLLADFFGSLEAAEAAFGFPFQAGDTAAAAADAPFPENPFDALEPLA
jgi:hypothetical protein